MRNLPFIRPVKVGMQVFLLLAMLIFNFGPGSTGTVYAAPLNDDFANANVIDNITYLDALNTTDATQDVTDPDNVGPCDGKQLNIGNNTVWYTYTPSVKETISVDTIGSTYVAGVDLDTYIAVWTGTEGALSLVACDDDTLVGLTSQLLFNATPGVQYYIEVATYNGDEGSSTGGTQNGGNLIFNAIISNTQVTIANTLRGRYYVPSGASKKVSYTSVSNGSVLVKGGNDQPFIAAMGVTYKPTSGSPVSYSQMIGFPANQATTEYYFPRYTTNASQSSQLRIANVGAATTDVKIFIGGALKQTISALGAGKAIQSNIWTVDSGPVRVVSTNPSVNIVASMLVTYKSGVKKVSTSELMGYPANQLKTAYLFPRNINSTTLKSQLRVANIGANKTTVRIFINNVLKTSIVDLAAGSSKAVSVGGTGLMKVVSTNSAVNIITSLRQIYYQNNLPVSYSEQMGFPINKLTKEYTFPWYTTNANMTTKLYFVNVGTADTTVEVYIKGSLKGSYPLAKGASKSVSYSGVDNGSVRVNSTNSSVKILTSMQITYKQNSLPVSYAEVTGYPYLVGQPTVAYLFPWYTNNTTFQSQLIFGYP